MPDLTLLIEAAAGGDRYASDQLLPLVYDELRHMAASKMSRENPGQTLDATALVHEAYLRMVDTEKVQNWNSRGHFFAAAAESMRRILVERARHKHSVKAGGQLHRQDLASADIVAACPDGELLALNDALEQLESHDKRKADVVKMRYFAGLTIEETAQMLGISVSTANNDWAYARSWLRLEISGGSRQEELDRNPRS